MIKGKKYLKKQAVASVLALSMAAASLTGCSNGLSSSKKESSNVGTMTQEEASTTKVMVIGDYDIYMNFWCMRFRQWLRTMEHWHQ